MDNILKLIILGASVLLTIGVVTVGINLYSTSVNVVQTAQNQMTSIQNNFTVKKFDDYNNKTLSGSQVINAIRTYTQSNNSSASFQVRVTTGILNPTTFVYDSQHPYAVTDPNDAAYIYPVSKFDSQVTVNEQNEIVGMTFTQKTN